MADPNVSTSVTVPVLWDKKTKTIVNNESSEIIRIFNSAFNSITGNALDLNPDEHMTEIDRFNDMIYEDINNGVYKSGFAKTQDAYNNAVKPLFNSLDAIDRHLEGNRYLVGDVLTEADIRLILLYFDLIVFIIPTSNVILKR